MGDVARAQQLIRRKDLLDVAGEVYVVCWFPWGWLVIVIVGIYCAIKGIKSLPEGFQIL